MPVGADFRISRVVIVESLERDEVKTGRVTAELVSALPAVRDAGVSVEYHSCSYAAAFVDFVRSLTADVIATGRTPLLHVECHGDATGGLEFENGSTLSWSGLSEELVALNAATRFNLLAIFSACYGAHFLSRLNTIDPAPCYAMIAPTEGVRVSEILAGFRMFYTVMFAEMDAGVAVDSIARTNLEAGHWFAQQAEIWYERVSIGFMEAECTKDAHRQRTLRAYRRALAEGKVASITQVKRDLQRLNREGLLGKFFDRYFMTAAIPENRQRFRAVQDKLNERISELRKTGRYAI